VFFGSMVNIFIPPSNIVFMYLLMASTMLIGMGLAWAWGAIVMKAALATRPASETQARLALLGQQAAQQAKYNNGIISDETQIIIDNGFMLDTRVSITWMFLICIFIYLLARLRAAEHKFILTQVFGTIIADLWLTIGPLLPSFQGTLVQALIKPAAAGVAIGLAANIFIFPESTSHQLLTNFQDLIMVMKDPVSLLSQRLGKKDHTVDAGELEGLPAKLLLLWADAEPMLSFLPLDFSFGRWNAQDIATLKEPMRKVMLATIDLVNWQLRTKEGVDKAQSLQETFGDDKQERLAVAHHQLLQTLDLVHSLRTEESELSIQNSFLAMAEPGHVLLDACEEAQDAYYHCLQLVNSRRWFGRPSTAMIEQNVRDHQHVLESLTAKRRVYTDESHTLLVQAHRHLFDEAGKLKQDSHRDQLSGLFFALVAKEHILQLTTALEALLKQAIVLEQKRVVSRIWAPTSLRDFAHWVISRNRPPHVSETQIDTVQNEAKPNTSLAEWQFKLKQQNMPRKGRKGLGRLILGVWQWFTNEEGTYALRVLIVTIAAGVPAMCKTSAGFYQREKGLWALIMAQTGITSFSADFAFEFVCKALGTIIGGILGMLAWYIGSGSGLGNPYGLAAVMAVFGTVIVWLRLWAPPHLLPATIMGSVTCFLIVGYSYGDTHIPEYGSPGVGYGVFWHRTVLVLVGFGLAAIVTILPRPSTASRHIMRSLSTAIHESADLYALVLSTWNSDSESAGTRISIAESATVATAESITHLEEILGQIRFEFSDSPFPPSTCAKVKVLCERISEHQGQLVIRTSQLSPYLRARFERTTGILNHDTIGDVMAVLSVIEQALKTGDPIPSLLPTPLVRRCFAAGEAEELHTLSSDLLGEEGFRHYCVALTAYLVFLGSLDECVMVLKHALGESHVVDFDLRMGLLAEKAGEQV
ncbi:hypothetical protein H2201_009098, partial [Coniosporium apollinis]